MKIILIVFVVLISACNSTPKTDVQPNGVVNESPAVEGPAVESQQVKTDNRTEEQAVPISKRVYYLQHKLLPDWTYTTEGLFYADLVNDDLTRLKMAASEIVSTEYANGISSQILKDGTSILIAFPEPKSMANCYFVIITKSDGGFSFYTYEKTMNFGDDDPVIGVVGHWTADGNHGNMGGRAYRKAEDFVLEILGDDR